MTIRLFAGLSAGLMVVAIVAMSSSEMLGQSGSETDQQALPGATIERDGGFFRGVALPLYYKELDRSYDQPLEEIAALGADTVSLVVTWSQADMRATEIGPNAEESRSDDIVTSAVEAAHRHGLRVFLFPILSIDEREYGEWRGTIEPSDVDVWFESYERFIRHYAEIAEEHSVALLSVGSELASMEQYETRWRAMIGDIRDVYSGELTYSANWDHYHLTPFWSAVDRVGLSGYWELTDSRDEPVVLATLVKRWAPIRDAVLAFVKQQEKRFIFTEIGYYSQVGTAWHPWDYTRSDTVDLDQQQLCYRAAYEVWRDVPEMSGIFFWHWFGDGGPDDGSYNPRGKPASDVIRDWYSQWPQLRRAGIDEQPQ